MSFARVLLVDDDVGLVRLMRRILASEFDVIVAPSATEVLEAIRAGARYDAIVTDVHMPDLDGAALHAGILAVAPALARRIVFVSGDSHPILHAARAAGCEVLAKPFHPDELLEAVRRVLLTGA